VSAAGICVAYARAAAKQLKVAAAVDRWDRRTDGQTDSVPLHRRLPLEAASINKAVFVINCCTGRRQRFAIVNKTPGVADCESLTVLHYFLALT